VTVLATCLASRRPAGVPSGFSFAASSLSLRTTKKPAQKKQRKSKEKAKDFFCVLPDN
jgi:hypothetical protein